VAESLERDAGVVLREEVRTCGEHLGRIDVELDTRLDLTWLHKGLDLFELN